ncbi:MAG: PIN domain-containing protein [Cyanobacteria bacterium P01_H01_bin.58]
MTESDRQLFQAFLQRVQVIDLASGDESLIRMIVEMRQQYRLKLPDAIIAAISLHHSASLMTADQAFKKVNELTTVSW